MSRKLAKLMRKARLHAIQRAQERYNVNLSEQDIHDIGVHIRNGKALELGSQNMGTVYAIFWKGVWLFPLKPKNRGDKGVCTMVPAQPLHLEKVIHHLEHNTKKDYRIGLEEAKKALKEMRNEMDTSY